MKLVCICKDCGRTIDKEYVYCPWCGLSQISSKTSNFFEDIFLSEKYEKFNNNQELIAKKQINQLEQKLNELENDISKIISLSRS